MCLLSSLPSTANSQGCCLHMNSLHRWTCLSPLLQHQSSKHAFRYCVWGIRPNETVFRCARNDPNVAWYAADSGNILQTFTPWVRLPILLVTSCLCAWKITTNLPATCESSQHASPSLSPKYGSPSQVVSPEKWDLSPTQVGIPDSSTQLM